ncbi:hypothetical protein [Vibrio vulnificus]|uniref:hypothetical protein n=1 Tax=Vibrio vulnificus TaxID=672 RepID=UPI001FAE9FA3|nr:hypothetical protein [Vibrio vulnificus]MCJ0813256.1 hypothetical protein [Vibrio vulnificus]
MDEVILGYLPCHTCKTPKKIIQGQGKRARFLRARCKCGPDCRTGEEIQAHFAKYKTLEEVEQMLKPTPEPEKEAEQEKGPEPQNNKTTSANSNAAKFLIGGFCFLLGNVTAKVLGANNG